MKSGGTLMGVGDDNIEISATDLIFRNVTASGSLTGLPSTADATLKFSVLTPVAPMIKSSKVGPTMISTYRASVITTPTRAGFQAVAPIAD